jgi:hypothetical protein
MSNSKKRLNVSCKDELLTITIGVDALINSLHGAMCCPFVITDKKKFLKELLNSIKLFK